MTLRQLSVIHAPSAISKLRAFILDVFQYNICSNEVRGAAGVYVYRIYYNYYTNYQYCLCLFSNQLVYYFLPA